MNSTTVDIHLTGDLDDDMQSMAAGISAAVNASNAKNPGTAARWSTIVLPRDDKGEVTPGVATLQFAAWPVTHG